MSTNIPYARKLIENALPHINDVSVLQDLNLALSMMTRTITKRPAKSTARKITSALVREVLLFIEQNPDVGNREIGSVFGIDGGRVSEIATGQRTIENPGMKNDGLNMELRDNMS